MGKSASKLIMVFNDTQEILELFEDILTGEGYRVSLHSFKIRELNTIREEMPDLLIIDLMFGSEVYGWELIQKVHMDAELAGIPIVVCTAELNKLKELEGHLKQKNIGAVVKPFDIEDLLHVVRKYIGDDSR